VRFRPLKLCVLVLSLALFPSKVCLAQANRLPPLPSQTAPEDPDQAKRDRDIAKKANQDRQEQLKRDTDNLFKLASQLKEYVDKSSENTLSLDVIRKADEIEKLAHNIKDKMKGN
jgi:predicted  nucleic acid-binding Zn-ribbon protein